MARQTFDPTDNLPAVEAKLDANAALDDALQTATGIVEGATSIGDTASDANALANSDSLVVRVKKLKALIDAGGGSLALEDLGVDYDLSTATGTTRGTTYVNQSNTSISSQYPLSADGLWNVEVRASSTISGQAFSAGDLLDFLLVRHSDTDTARVFHATKSGGVMSPWVDVSGTAPALLTNNLQTRSYLPVNTNTAPRLLVNGGFYRCPVTTVAGSDGYPYSPPVDTPMVWQIQVEHIGDAATGGGTVGRLEARSYYSDGGAQPVMHTWEAFVTLASSGTAWETPVWRYKSGAAVSANPERGVARKKAARRELWLKIGQSNAVGVDHKKEDGVNQEPYEPLGKDKPNVKVHEVSRGEAYTPTIRAPQHETHVFHGYAWDGEPDPQGRRPKVTFSHYFGNQRTHANPEIERLAIVNSAQGGTQMSQWASGTQYFVAARDRCNDFLLRHPEYSFGGIIWHQGESDAIAGRTQAQYEADVAAMVAAFRSQIVGAENCPFIAGTMSVVWREVDTGGTTVAMKDEIHQAHLRTPKYIANSAVVNLDDLRVVANTPAWQSSATVTDDIIHFSREFQREMGRRYGVAADGLTDFSAVSNGFPTYRMRYDATAAKYTNGLDRGIGEIFGQRFASDADRGLVLTTDVVGDGSEWAGFYSDLHHDVNAYTLALRVRLKGTIGNGNSFISHGNNTAGQAKLMTVNAIDNGSASATGTGFAGDIPADTWVHLAVTFNGTEFQRYLNGVADGAAFAPSAGSPAFDYTQIGQCQIGKWENGANQQWQGLIDDIFVASSALPAAAIGSLFRS